MSIVSERKIEIRTKTDAGLLLKRLKEEVEFPLSAPVDVDAIARILGIDVNEESRPGSPAIGSITVRQGSSTIWLNPLENNYPPRRRFTLAHEIGHYCLHLAPGDGRSMFEDTEKTLTRQSSYWNIEEFEANRFAADLLMPVELINQCGKKIIDDYRDETGCDKIRADRFVAGLSEVLKVSKVALEFRLKNLDVIPNK